jgi:hypothetical protein
VFCFFDCLVVCFLSFLSFSIFVVFFCVCLSLVFSSVFVLVKGFFVLMFVFDLMKVVFLVAGTRGHLTLKSQGLPVIPVVKQHLVKVRFGFLPVFWAGPPRTVQKTNRKLKQLCLYSCCWDPGPPKGTRGTLL